MNNKRKDAICKMYKDALPCISTIIAITICILLAYTELSLLPAFSKFNV